MFPLRFLLLLLSLMKKKKLSKGVSLGTMYLNQVSRHTVLLLDGLVTFSRIYYNAAVHAIRIDSLLLRE